MDNLPNEMICHIFGLVNDRMNASMVCKKWNILMDNMYKQNLISNFNDLYYFKRYLDEIGILNIHDEIFNITNHDCLNYICYGLQKIRPITKINCSCILLEQHCKVNNISNYKFITYLINWHVNFGKICDMIRTCLKYQSYDMLIFFQKHYPGQFNSHVILYYWDKTELDTTISTFETLIAKNIFTLNTIYILIFKSSIFLKEQLLTHFKTKISPNIIKILEC